LVSIFSIWACYGFRYAPTSDPNLHFDFNAIVDRAKNNIWRLQNEQRDFSKLTQEQANQIKDEIASVPVPKAAPITKWFMDHRILPEAWLDGFFYTYATTLMRGSFLNGKYSLHGWWYFFPLAVLYKTPTAMLLAGVIAIVAWIIIAVRSRAIFGHPDVPTGPMWSVNSGVWSAICLLMPVIIYGGMAMTSHFNLGIRHVLPLLPFAHLAAGLFVARLLWRWGKLGALVAAGLGMGLAIESCTAWPNYISFFNEVSGGSRKAIHRMSDSNLDWGQDLRLLAEWQKQHPEKVIYLCYFGMADPDYYKIKHYNLMGGYELAQQALQTPDPRVPGIIAISATRLQGTYNGEDFRKVYEPLWRCEPREVLGGTIYLYDWPLRFPTTQQ
jgi:hypothetical protein